MAARVSFRRQHYHQLRLSAVKRFYWHVFFYLLAAILFIVVNALWTPDRIWFYIPVTAWGAWVTVHGATVFGFERVARAGRISARAGRRKVRERCEGT